MTNLTNKVFIITGGNGGIGLGMAEGIAPPADRLRYGVETRPKMLRL